MDVKALLLIVDVQNGFVNDRTRHVIAPINSLVSRWQSKGLPIAISKFINPQDGPWERLRDWHEMKSSPETELHPDLNGKDAQIFEKSTYSAWSDEVLSVCRQHGISNIVICGIDTNECVLATAIDVFEADLTPWVVKDACASNGGEKSHDMGIAMIESLIGKQQVVESSVLLSDANG